MSALQVANVSDTARWVATYRAWESARPDALFRDPFAERLAGEHGQAIAEMMPRQARSGWPLIVRTRLIDDLILNAITEGCDCVINLAAGLDTRPYRMKLPRSLRWIEADLPAMVAEKERVLAAETPVCRLSRQRVDLSDPDARAAFLDESLLGSTRALVISEGLLIYLNEVVVRTLAIDLAARTAAHWWVVDLASPSLLQLMQKTMGPQLVNAPMIFAPANGVAFFEPLGWSPQDIRSLLHEAARLHRLPWFLQFFAFLPPADPRHLSHARWSAVIRFTRSAYPATSHTARGLDCAAKSREIYGLGPRRVGLDIQPCRAPAEIRRGNCGRAHLGFAKYGLGRTRRKKDKEAQFERTLSGSVVPVY